tara:strand:- start:1271 stop:2314 length:1044 start_codon:yes stop_codon:yes gene_type:complete
MSFCKTLLKWYDINKRELPWRQTSDPYVIWISEIILQQTRVSQGIPYFYKFIQSFPSLKDLANAQEEEVLKLWQGLGYYSRARNLHSTAKYINEKYNGIFPSNLEDILSLKGVGNYTAAAISSFAFDISLPVVDGNVVRVLSRIFGVEMPFESSSGKKKFYNLATKLLDSKRHSEYNQAIMDFGALCCTPKLPKCESCPFVSICIAYNTNNINKLPVKLKKIKITKRFLNYLIINHEEQFVLSKINQGIWKGMYQFPFVEVDNKTNKNKLLESENWKKFFCNYKYKVTGSSEVYLHKLSHQKIYATFWFIDVHNFNKNNFKCVRKHEFIKLPIPRLIDKFINDYKLI